ncbi:hypothetical protein CPB85DRAFT_133191 [Mucidula mucida]|nr:hypothetical protein CPB85DRAFT_133191 [Mucidula mucida]
MNFFAGPDLRPQMRSIWQMNQSPSGYHSQDSNTPRVMTVPYSKRPWHLQACVAIKHASSTPARPSIPHPTMNSALTHITRDDPNDGGDGGLQAGTIAGIVFGVVLSIALVICLVFAIRELHKRRLLMLFRARNPDPFPQTSIFRGVETEPDIVEPALRPLPSARSSRIEKERDVNHVV